MRERWGVEREQQDARYRLSFTVGGLLMPQGVVYARCFVDAVPRPDAPNAQVGAAVASIRDGVVDENVLAIRTRSANMRVTSEVCKRLSALSYAELGFLASDDASPQDRRYLMWIAMCRYYLFVGEFAADVLRDRFLLGESISYADYDRFVLDRASWHPELESLSTATATKLRSNLFKAMREAELTVRDSHGADVPVPAVRGPTLAAVLEPHADSLRFLPSRDSMN